MIGIYTNTPKKVNGCYKVVKNLFKGLDELGIDYVENKQGDINGNIHGATREFMFDKLSTNTLIGPEIIVLPSENKKAFERYKNWCQPSLWCVQYMKTFDICKDTNFHVWPCGIDTDEFKPNKQPIEQDCFIYYKNVTKQTPESKIYEAIAHCNKLGLTYKVIKYGSYTEDELKHLCNTSSFAIWLAGSESENIALMEVLAMDVPIYVIDEKEFKYNDFTWEGASSAPYFNEQCGWKSNGMLYDFAIFAKKKAFKPRQYILDNHTCKHGAQKYIDILKECK